MLIADALFVVDCMKGAKTRFAKHEGSRDLLTRSHTRPARPRPHFVETLLLVRPSSRRQRCLQHLYCPTRRSTAETISHTFSIARPQQTPQRVTLLSPSFAPSLSFVPHTGSTCHCVKLQLSTPSFRPTWSYKPTQNSSFQSSSSFTSVLHPTEAPWAHRTQNLTLLCAVSRCFPARTTR